MDVYLFTDASTGKHMGGVGYVILGVSDDLGGFLYEHKHPLPPGLTQLQAELYAILSGLESVDLVLASHELEPKQVFLHVMTDCKAAIHAIHHACDQGDQMVRVLCKRIIKTVAGSYNRPPGGGAEYQHLTAKKKGKKLTAEQRRLQPNMVRAHQLSREARLAFKGLL